MMEESSYNADRATVLISVTASSVAFIIAFNFGAFETIFFVRIFALWVAATIVLVASFFTSVEPQNWLGRLALLFPTLWLLLQSAVVTGVVSVNDAVVGWLALVTAIVALPFLGYAIIGAINPSFLDLPIRNKWAIIIAVVVFSVLGAAIGARNDLFLTCDDFKVSGNDQPENCRGASASPAAVTLASSRLGYP